MGPSNELTASGVRLADVYLAWDASTSRFVFAAIDLPGGPGMSVWFGYYDGNNWVTQGKALVGSSTFPEIDWDYPSIAVDGAGRIIVGAVQYSLQFYDRDLGFFVTVSTDSGSHFSDPVRVGSDDEGLHRGYASRVVATYDQFHVFVIPLDRYPARLYRYESPNGENWSTPYLLMNEVGRPDGWSEGSYSNSCAEPCMPCSCVPGPDCGPIFYSLPSFVDARGTISQATTSHGLWTVVFLANIQGYSNVVTCNNKTQPPCWILNPIQDDQFMASTSVARDEGFWVSYKTYSTLNTRRLPLGAQTFYIRPDASRVSGTIEWNLDPKTWWSDTKRCAQRCFAEGDYAGIASNDFAAATVPFVKQSVQRKNDLLQTFVEDPVAASNIPNFQANSIGLPFGASLRSLAAPDSFLVREPKTRPTTAFLLGHEGRR